MKKARKSLSKNLIFGIGLFLIATGTGCLTYQYISEKKELVVENKQIEEFITKTTEEEVIVEEENKPTEIIKVENYNMVIKISKINLNKGLYNINSKLNDVKYNIQVIKESDMPDIVNGNLILAGHNGTSSIAYFNKLYKLDNGDKVYIYYQNHEYIYEIVDIYDISKTGKAVIHRDSSETIIALITCKKGTRDKQTVYIGNLINKTDY